MRVLSSLPLIVPLLATACVDDGLEDAADETSSETQEVRNLDGVPPTPGVFTEASLTTGRLRDVPFGYVEYVMIPVTTGSYSGGYYVRALSTCYDANQSREMCDPGLVVARTTGGPLQFLDGVYSDQNADAGAISAGVYGGNAGAQTNPQNAMVTIYQGPNQTRNYYVAAYSAARGTSKINLNLEARTIKELPAWSTWASFTSVSGEHPAGIRLGKTVGGTLVNLGPTQAGDVLEARAPGNANEGIQRLWTFNLGKQKWAWSTTTQALDASWTGGTPSTWSTSYALVGFTAPGQTGMGAEKYVDLTLSPSTTKTWHVPSWQNCSAALDNTSRPDCVDTNQLTLGGGNYTFWTMARTDFPVGKSPAITGGRHRAGIVAAVCTDEDVPDVSTERGQGNDLAFKLELTVDGTVVRSRYVPRGALGSSGAGLFDLFSIDYRIPDDGLAHAVRLHVRHVGPAVTLQGFVGYQRNLEAQELKLATANLEYDCDKDGLDLIECQEEGEVQSDSEVKNAARLLGGSTDYGSPGQSNVYYQANKAGWRWNSDVIAFQEILPGKAGLMREILDTRTPFAWNHDSQIQIDATGGPFGTNRYGPVFLKAGSTHPNGLLFPNFDYTLGGGFMAEGERGDYYTMPYRAAVKLPRSDGTVDSLPVAVFNVYMPSKMQELTERKAARRGLSDIIDNLSAMDPGAFSPFSPSDPARFRDNFRAVILGDSNMLNHMCAENNEWLEELRARFGYAIDVSMAAVGPDKRTFDLHYGTMPLDYQGYGGWYAGVYSSSNQPFGYQGQEGWAAQTDNLVKYATGPTQRYAWWADTRTFESGSEARHDVIILVGRGWALDDPVRDYMVVPNLQYNPNTMTNFGVGAVDLRLWCDHEGAGDDRVPTSDGSAYIPDFHDVCPDHDGSAASGKAVYRSDHKPVGAKLRLVPRPNGTL